MSAYYRTLIKPFSEFVGLIDTYPAPAAYSMRKLSATATKCLRVRRTNQIGIYDENEEMDIGFSTTPDANGNYWLDTETLWGFCSLVAYEGQGNGYVTKIYDQSGNNRDFIQKNAASQSVIVSNSVVLTENGHPSFVTIGGGGYYVTDNLTFGVSSPVMHAAYIAKHRTPGGNGYVFSLISNATLDRHRFASWVSAPNSRASLYMSSISNYGGSGTTQGAINDAENTFYSSLRQVFMTADPQGAAGDMYLYRNNGLRATGNQNNDNFPTFHALPIRKFTVATVSNFALPELIIYEDDKYAAMEAISTNQITAWNII